MDSSNLIHAIWLGPNPIPTHYLDKWADLHPEREVILHTEPFDDMILRKEYEASPTWVHRSDILRIALCWKYGGWYTDLDMEPLRSLTNLVAPYPAWIGYENPNNGIVGCALFGFPPMYSGVRPVIAYIRKRAIRAKQQGWDKPNFDSGPTAWQIVKDFHHFPPKTFYPVFYNGKARIERRRTRFEADPEVYAVHHYAYSWRDMESVSVRRSDADL